MPVVHWLSFILVVAGFQDPASFWFQSFIGIYTCSLPVLTNKSENFKMTLGFSILSYFIPIPWYSLLRLLNPLEAALPWTTNVYSLRSLRDSVFRPGNCTITIINTFPFMDNDMKLLDYNWILSFLKPIQKEVRKCFFVQL